ncbi:MAG: ATP-binding protein [Candidatus Aminicenantes bacterium]|nr:ATP-binding protein [Candidatus Aminicenantes bacterium]
MGHRKASFYIAILAGAAILGLSGVGFVGLLGRAEIPWDTLAQTTGIPAELLPRAIVRADGFEARDIESDFKFVEARHKIGDPVEFVFRKDGREETVSERLVAHYAQGTFPLVYLLTAALGFIIGFGVYFLRSEDERARVFFWLCLAFSSAVLISGEWYGVQGRALYLIPGVLFFFAYTLTPALLLKFALTLASRSRIRGFPAIWGASLLFAAFFSAAFASALLFSSVEIFRIKKYFVLFRLYFLVLCVAAVVVLFRSYRASASRECRDQIKWIFYGMAVGLGPFMALYQLPRVLGLNPLMGEEAASAFLVLLPLAMAIAILKHKLMDITLIINRSLVYSLLTMITVGVYLLSVEGLKQLFTGPARPGRGWVPIGAAVIAAVAFAPVRNRIQVLVDKAFFRRGYDYRRAVRDFNMAAAKAFSAGELLESFENILADFLPVEKVGGLVLEPGDGPPGPVLRRGLDGGAVSLFARGPEPGSLWTDVRPDIPGFEVTLPLPLGEGGLAGWVVVGPKKSGLKFTEEDRELLETMAAEMAAALRRIRLQEEVVYERASREKSEELGRLKTEFISSVSHELRTPMTSLQGISRLLQSGKVGDEARRERLLELMAGECGRLGRFLHNVLDFGRIEQDAKRYEFRETDIKPLVGEVAEIARSAAGEELDLEIETPEGPVWVEADADAVRQALLNLMDNAIKYSAGRKRVAVRLAENAGHAEVSVSDQGIGIPAEDREKIFEAFFRSPAAVRHNPKGVGLGLKIVKHIMDAHGGTIDLRSKPGKGTKFTLIFPKRRIT